MATKVHEHLETENVKRFISETQCSLNEAAAVAYYSADAERQCSGTEEQSIYRIVNRLLANHQKEELNPWQPFLFYLCCAEEKLPTLTTKTYRGITVRLTEFSSQYRKGNEVAWAAFTSVGLKKEVLFPFSKNEGTWMRIDAIEAKDISKISLFSRENEAILFPNTVLRVVKVLSEKEKQRFGIPARVDAIHFAQTPTPKRSKPLATIPSNSKGKERRVSPDAEFIKMLHWYREGDYEALYQNGLHFQRIQDEENACNYFYLAAKGGHPGAHYQIGMMHYELRDYAPAVQSFTLSADQGFPDAQLHLGLMYQCGLGVPRSYSRANELFERAAVQGNACAYNALGLAHQNGLGIKRDVKKAISFYTEAAYKGQRDALESLYCLGVFYYQAQDYLTALACLIPASDNGHLQARSYLFD